MYPYKQPPSSNGRTIHDFGRRIKMETESFINRNIERVDSGWKKLSDPHASPEGVERRAETPREEGE